MKAGAEREEAKFCHDTEFLHDFNWGRVAGRRFDDTVAFQNTEYLQGKTIAFGAVLAPFRYAIAWCLDRTHTAGCTAPPLYDLVNARYSPITRALQYLHSLVTTDPQDRLLAVAMLCGHRTVIAFIRDHPLSWVVGSSAKVSSAWFFWRNLRYKFTPFTLVSNSDPRISQADKLANSNTIYKANRCCHDEACTLKVIARTTRAAQLLSARNVRLSQGIGRSPVHNAIAETLHARNQRKNDQNTSWATRACEMRATDLLLSNLPP